MGATPTNISVSVVDPVACIKVTGRANFSVSVDFKTVIYELHHRGFRVFLMDLTDCVIMDSTFLGVMSGFAIKLGHEAKDSKTPCIQLLNANDRVRGLLDNLGVEQLFKHRTGNNPFQPKFQDVPTGVEASKVEVSRTCLEAHETLMLLNPNNVPKFKDVAKFLAEDLKKAEQEIKP
jgi:anti-sigma B factor antagonist